MTNFWLVSLKHKYTQVKKNSQIKIKCKNDVL